MKKLIKGLFFVSILHITACSSGGGGGGSSHEFKTGVFLDSPVTGLRYETPYNSGYTDDDGQFQYVDGQEITFKIGDIHLGTVFAKEVVTPIDLSGVIADTTEQYIPDDQSLNILRFLQTIGQTDAYYRGLDTPRIIILERQHRAAKDTHINFTQNSTAFASDAQVLSTIETLSDLSMKEKRKTQLVSMEQAQLDFSKSVIWQFGVDVDWQNYLAMQHGKQLTYARTIQSDTTINDEVSTVFKSTQHYFRDLGDPLPIWVQDWSENWQPNNYKYFENVDSGVKLIGYVLDANTETFINDNQYGFDNTIINGQWLYREIINDGQANHVKYKIDMEQQLMIGNILYSNVIKLSQINTTTDTTTETWFAPNVGMIKQVKTNGETLETLNLASSEIVDVLPDDPASNRAAYLKDINDVLVGERDNSSSNMTEALSALYLAMGLSGKDGSEEHLDAFKITYFAYMAEYGVKLTDIVLSTASRYTLDSRGVSHVLQAEYTRMAATIALFSIFTIGSDLDFIKDINDQVFDIFTKAGDLIVLSGAITEYTLDKI